jgi:dihydroorotase
MKDWKDKKEFWITGAKIADPAGGRIRAGSVCVRKGEIAEIAWQKQIDSDLPVFDAEGAVLAPGFIDVHAHLREPGFEDKETIETGTAAAAAGGYTAVLCMANTDPPVDDPSVVKYILRRAAEAGHCRVYVAGAVTKGLAGSDICEYRHLKEAGAVALSDDGRWVVNSRTMRSALEYARMLGLPVIAHCEDSFLAAGTQMNEGFTSTRLGLKGTPAASEEIAVSRDIMLAQLTGAHLHVAHVSTKGSVDLIRAAKRRGVRVTAEATPHHLALDETMLAGYDRSLKVNPPLRSREDVAALRAALKDGTIDCIATDHAPHSEIDKQVEFDLAPPGMTGLETAFALLHTELVLGGQFDMITLLSLLTAGPARALGLPGGTIAVGAPADLALIDPAMKWIPERGKMRSRSNNTPLLGRELTGRVLGIFLEGSWKPGNI